MTMTMAMMAAVLMMVTGVEVTEAAVLAAVAVIECDGSDDSGYSGGGCCHDVHLHSI
jgi:hypothetical protein